MTARADSRKIAPGAMRALFGVNNYLTEESEIPKQLIDLVFLRTSQINGCAHCIDMHSRDLIEGGMDVEKLVLVPVWREAKSLFHERERAALAWTESVTNVSSTEVPDADYEAASSVFSDKDLVDLTVVVSLMNAYNRLGVAFRLPIAAAASARE